ncbi:MAG: hypothetical protein AB1705_19750 [Verrucomicrobiota bacterium]
MKSPSLYKCSPEFAKAWWVPLEEAGFTVERLSDQAIVKSANAEVFIHPSDDGHLMLVFSAIFFWGKNQRLAQQVDKILLQHCPDAADIHA